MHQRLKTVFAQESVCTCTRLVDTRDTGLWMQIPGSRKVPWKLSVDDGSKDKDAEPPFGTFTVTPYTPDTKD